MLEISPKFQRRDYYLFQYSSDIQPIKYFRNFLEDHACCQDFLGRIKEYETIHGLSPFDARCSQAVNLLWCSPPHRGVGCFGSPRFGGACSRCWWLVSSGRLPRVSPLRRCVLPVWCPLRSGLVASGLPASAVCFPRSIRVWSPRVSPLRRCVLPAPAPAPGVWSPRCCPERICVRTCDPCSIPPALFWNYASAYDHQLWLSIFKFL